eukprot:NODE_120_length_17920_cov_0.559782.p14 type:complete len:139 gc:universal NODE_120_length_17920_cov_0.559782:5108-4692(-)
MFLTLIYSLMLYSVGSDCSNYYLWKAFNPTITCNKANTWDCKKIEGSTNVTQVQCNETGLTTIFSQNVYQWEYFNVTVAVVADGKCYLDPLTKKGYISNCTHVQECANCGNCSVLKVSGGCTTGTQRNHGNRLGWMMF